MESKRLAGKTAVVTAAASGIGRASAESFARAGARVIAADIDGDALKNVVGCEGFALQRRGIRVLRKTPADAIGRNLPHVMHGPEIC